MLTHNFFLLSNKESRFKSLYINNILMIKNNYHIVDVINFKSYSIFPSIKKMSLNYLAIKLNQNGPTIPSPYPFQFGYAKQSRSDYSSFQPKLIKRNLKFILLTQWAKLVYRLNTLSSMQIT